MIYAYLIRDKRSWDPRWITINLCFRQNALQIQTFDQHKMNNVHDGKNVTSDEIDIVHDIIKQNILTISIQFLT